MLSSSSTVTQLDSPSRRLDRYVLFDEIASGGMATVHFGRLVGSVGFARTVAIKRLHPMFAKAPEFVEMFTDEARLAARMRHPNIAATLDVVSIGGELFLVMEYIQGESVARLLRLTAQRKETVPVPIAVAIAVGTLMGLHAAHEATTEGGEFLGVVHRDVSPQNIMVGSDGVPRVLDFGVAKAVGRLQTTRDGEVKGKTAYMAPEQLSRRDVDRRADIYAASVVLWEVLTGHRLFVADTVAGTLSQVLGAEVEPPSRYASAVPVELDALVLRGLSRDRHRRFATALEMASALERTVLLPTPREIGTWLQSVAAESLASHREILRRIESAEVGTGQPLASFEAPRARLVLPAQAATAVMVPGPAARRPRAQRRPMWLLLPAAIAGGAAAFLGGMHLPRRPAPGAPAPGPSVASSALVERSSPEPIASAVGNDVVGGEAGAEPPRAAPAVAPPSTRAQSSSGHEPRPAATRRAPAAPAPAPSRSCNPPYIIDKDGIHIPKAECG
jgi:serine/threonine-protein kinase